MAGRRRSTKRAVAEHAGTSYAVALDAFVPDASIAIAWVHPDQATAESNAWLEHVAAGAALVVPSVWPLEVANALIVLARRRKLTSEDRDAALATLAELPVTLDHDGPARALTELAVLATSESLTVYDASYLELARRRALPLACRDGPLRKAAIRHGLKVTP